MKLSHILKTGEEEYNVRVEFEKNVLSNGRPVLVVKNTQSGKDDRYIVLASLRNWPRFEKWVGLKAKSDIKKTMKSFETMRGEQLQGVLLNTEVVIKNGDDENGQTDSIKD